MSKILSNQRRCTKCNEEIFSATVHDYKTCTCGEVMVDGGMSYIRQSLAGESMNICVSDEHYEKLMEAVSDPSRNDLGHLCNIVRVLRDDMGLNLTNYSEE